jgi:hypothetical protein
VVIRQPNEAAQTQWRRVVDFAKRNRMLPPGTRVEKTRLRTGDVQIQLLDGYHPNTRPDRIGSGLSVPIPTELDAAHPVVDALGIDQGRLVMPGRLRQRAVLYLHGLTAEAIRRGHTVASRPVAARHRGVINTYGHRDQPDYSRREGELDILVEGVAATVEIKEKHPESTDPDRGDRLIVTLRPAYLSRGRQYRWSDGVPGSGSRARWPWCSVSLNGVRWRRGSRRNNSAAPGRRRWTMPWSRPRRAGLVATARAAARRNASAGEL